MSKMKMVYDKNLMTHLYLDNAISIFQPSQIYFSLICLFRYCFIFNHLK